MKTWPRIRQFYADRQYGGGVQPQDTVLVAEVDGGLVGVVRLAPEHGTLVLRGMQVHPSFQRQGIGTQVLAVLAGELGEQPCFCIPYAHLTDFYARIGFEVIEPERAPAFLAERLESYRARGDGKEYVLMHRPATLPIRVVGGETSAERLHHRSKTARVEHEPHPAAGVDDANGTSTRSCAHREAQGGDESPT